MQGSIVTHIYEVHYKVNESLRTVKIHKLHIQVLQLLLPLMINFVARNFPFNKRKLPLFLESTSHQR